LSYLPFIFCGIALQSIKLELPSFFHLTKFAVLRPLTSKLAADVGFQLLDIFLLYGAPHMLQSDNVREFTANIIKELKDMWPDCTLVHGKLQFNRLQCNLAKYKKLELPPFLFGVIALQSIKLELPPFYIL
jgi:hypothetical protein